jgi:hypothetical protein
MFYEQFNQIINIFNIIFIDLKLFFLLNFFIIIIK